MIYEKFRNTKIDDFFKTYILDSENLNGVFKFPESDIQKITNSLSGKNTACAAVDIFKEIINKDLIFNTLVPECKFLDYGCGWGRITRLFSYFIKDENIYGVDPNQILINSAKNSLPSFNFILNNNLERINLKKNYFDFIFLNSVFSHLSERSMNFALKEINNLLKNNQIMVASFLTIEDLNRLYKSKSNWFLKLVNNSLNPNPYDSLRKEGFWWSDSKRFPDYGLMIITNEFVEKKFKENNFLLKFSFKTSINSQTYFCAIKKNNN